MKKLILIIILFSKNYILSQSKGYFGKNNLIEFGINIQNPSLYNYKITSTTNEYEIQNTPYIKKHNSLELGNPKINYGFRLSLGRMIERNLGVYIETGLNYFSVVADQNANSFSNFMISNYSNLNAEMMDIQNFSILPKFELSSKEGFLPIGISNQIGIGFNRYKAIEKDYLGTVSVNYDTISIQNLPITSTNFYNFSNSSIKGYTLLYKLTLRIPISNRILFHFGFRYTFNFVPNSAYKTNQNEIISQDNMRKMIKLKENRNLLNFETGLSFSF